jgi:hypothetical protein
VSIDDCEVEAPGTRTLKALHHGLIPEPEKGRPFTNWLQTRNPSPASEPTVRISSNIGRGEGSSHPGGSFSLRWTPCGHQGLTAKSRPKAAFA